MLKLREIRARQKLTMKELGKKVGVSESAIGLYENGKRKPDFDMLLKLAEALDSSVPELTGTEELFGVKIRSALDKRYAALDEYGKQAVDAVLDIEYRRCTGEVAKTATKIIPLFPAAAGPGEPVDGEAFDDYEVPEDSKAAFAVRISGDSMEPEFHHGDVVLCEKRIAKDGEIAVIMVNGCLLVKQYIPDSFGNIYLRSLNRNRKDLDVDILASGNYTVQGWGTVIHKRIPLVEQ